MIKKEIPPKRTGLVRWYKRLSTNQKLLFWPIIITLLSVISGAVFHFCDKSNSNTGDQSINIQQKGMSGTTNYNISGDFTGNIIFQDLRSKGDHVSELAKREQMREQEREKDPKIGMSAKEPKHQESTTTNVALNKPVAGIYLDIKRVDDSESGKAKKRFALAVDGRRLSSFVGYHERHSINQGGYACNLTDGDLATRAYPADFAFDYIIDLKQKYQLTEIRLNWGSFGEQIEKHNYITRWEVYGQDSFTSEVFPDLKSDWMLIKSGGIPRKRSETIKGKELEQHTFWRLRIRAFSDPAVENRQANWIGIYEVEAYGIPLNNN